MRLLRFMLAALGVVGCGEVDTDEVVQPDPCEDVQSLVYEGNVESAADAEAVRDACASEIDGSVVLVVPGAADLHALARIERVSGALSLGPSADPGSPDGWWLPALQVIDGDLELTGEESGERMVVPAFPALASVGGDVRLDRVIVGTTSLSQLGMVHGDVWLSDIIVDSADALGLEEITGRLYVDPGPEARDGLPTLGELRTVGGLSVYGAGPLASLSGIERLSEIRGPISLWVTHPGLVSLRGLPDGVRVPDGLVRIDGCARLRDLEGLGALRLFGSDLDIHDNAALTDVSALAAFDHVGSLRLHDNDALEVVDIPAGLDQLGGLSIHSNGSLVSIAALGVPRPVRSVGIGGSQLVDIAGLKDVTDLENLSVIGTGIRVLSVPGTFTRAGEVRIRSNRKLERIERIGELERVDWLLRLEGNSALERIDGLETLRVAGEVVIEESALASYRGLHNLERADSVTLLMRPDHAVQGGFDALESVDMLAIGGGAGPLPPFPALREAREIHVFRGASLPDLPSLRSAEKVTVDSHELRSLEGFSALEQITGELVLADVPGLSDLDGLDGLVVANRISIWNCDAVEDISGFGGLREVGELSITYNDALRDISGFGVLDDVGSLEVVGNRGLTDAAAWAFVERLPGWPDSVRIEAN